MVSLATGVTYMIKMFRPVMFPLSSPVRVAADFHLLMPSGIRFSLLATLRLMPSGECGMT